MNLLKLFLDNKPLYYEEIDYTRMPRVYESIKSSLKISKIIHVIGTNGKGTTGRFLATSLFSLGFSVGHYTSPHILDFNERIWINGKSISDENLDTAHKELLKILSKEDADSLSYFEYTTLLAMWVYQDLDYIVLEAGLGGEFDATAVFKNILTLVTPIDIDHEAFLGNTISKIANTKLNAVQRKAIVSTQRYVDIYNILNKKEIVYKKVEDYIDKNDEDKIDIIKQNLSLAPYLVDNLKLAISALKELGLEYTSDSFINSRLFGRLTPLTDKIFLDVGHNTLAANAIVNSLADEKYILIYNSYKDKNYREILRILKPLIYHVEIIDIFDDRAEKRDILEAVLNELDISFCSFKGVEKLKKYLVFGSFSVVESFLKVYNG